MKKIICTALAALVMAGAFVPCNTAFIGYAAEESFETPAAENVIKSKFQNCKIVMVTDEGTPVFEGWDRGAAMRKTRTLFTLGSDGKISDSFALPEDIDGGFSIRQSGEDIYILYESLGSGKAPKRCVKLIVLGNDLGKKGEYNYGKFSKYVQYLDAGDNKIAYVYNRRYLYVRDLDGGNKRLLFDGGEWEEKIELNTVAVNGDFLIFGAQNYMGEGEYYGIANTVTGEVTIERNDKLYTPGIMKFGDVCIMSCKTDFGKRFTFEGQQYAQIKSPRRLYIFKDGAVTELVTEADNEMSCITVTPSGDIITMESNIYKYGKEYGKDFNIVRVYRDGKCIRRIAVDCGGYTGMYASDNALYIGQSLPLPGHEGKSWNDMSAVYVTSTVRFGLDDE